MKLYKNLSNESGIAKYEILSNGIRVQWDSGAVYFYSGESTGVEHIAEMKRLAELGKGLATYINQHVRENYEYKE